jgi:hypothetical protein
MDSGKIVALVGVQVGRLALPCPAEPRILNASERSLVRLMRSPKGRFFTGKLLNDVTIALHKVRIVRDAVFADLAAGVAELFGRGAAEVSYAYARACGDLPVLDNPGAEARGDLVDRFGAELYDDPR